MDLYSSPPRQAQGRPKKFWVSWAAQASEEKRLSRPVPHDCLGRMRHWDRSCPGDQQPSIHCFEILHCFSPKEGHVMRALFDWSYQVTATTDELCSEALESKQPELTLEFGLLRVRFLPVISLKGSDENNRR